eukprot:TRINITY_DN17760_c0_g1_i1.p1 TRINITY_DN17760_c0_g1~~TRINITY_DN17760_c0_g1_i1.p1  ORF type:complete len:587 (-),score=64.89 TRINITY_DN17760_c0_g1_i1:200-1723(-)
MTNDGLGSTPYLGSATIVQSSKGAGDTADELWQHKPEVHFVDDFDAVGMPVINIDTSAVDQVILGFGGAFTETAATVFYGLSRAQQDEIVNLYFGGEGLGYTMGRTHINSCDFSLTSYSFDDVPDDTELKHFDDRLQRDVDSGLIPFIERAQQKVSDRGEDLKLLASPWSPPAWMKTNGQMDGDGNDNDTDALRPRYYKAWAKYIARWIAAHKARNIKIWAISVQNEPLKNQRWESSYFTVNQEIDFLSFSLGPILSEHHPEVEIFVYDMFEPYVYDWAKAVYAHPVARTYVSGIAWHWYSGDLFSLVSKIHEEYPSAKLLPSELTYEQVKWAPGTMIEDGDWSFGEGYGHDIIGNLNAGAVGWIDWNLLLDPVGGPNHVGNVCDAAIMANASIGRIFVHPQYYYIGHFSRYILPGSRRMKSTVSGSRGPVNLSRALKRGYGVCSEEDGLQSTTFERPDKRLVTVVLNCGADAIDFKLRDGHRAIRGKIPSHAIQTYVYDRSSSTSR